MIRKLPAVTIEAIVDYAHRKAAYFFYDDLEDTISDMDAIDNYDFDSNI
jgi:hypothetical protein